MANNLSKMGDS